jgi:RND family efflux transporter MFP subunit
MRNRIKKPLIWLVVVVLVVLFIWRTYEVIQKDAVTGVRSGFGGALAIEIEEVQRESIREVRDFTGGVRAAYQYDVAVKVSGRLSKILPREGDYVEVQEVLALLDDTEYQLSLLEAEANLASARASLADAQSQLILAGLEYNRAEALYRKDYISLSEYEKAQALNSSAQAKLDLSQSQLDQREAVFSLAEIRLGYTELRASQAGYIGERYCDEGCLLPANSAVLSIVGIDSVIIRTYLVEEVYNRVRLGQEASIFTDAFPGELFQGRVSTISPVLSEQSRMAKMEISVDNKKHSLKPGMFCRIALTLLEEEDAQTVPNKAIITDKSRTGIFVYDEGEKVARYIEVKLGISSDKKTQILSPEINKPVITLGQYQVKDGSKVNPVNK